MKALRPILLLCAALCFATACNKEVDMTLKQKTMYENTDISLFHVDDAWDVTFVYDSLNSYVKLEYSAYLEEYVSVWDTNGWLSIGFNKPVYKPAGSVFKATVHTSEKEHLYIMAENASVIAMERLFEMEHFTMDLRNASVCSGFTVSAQSCSILLTDESQLLGVKYDGTDCSVFASRSSSCKGYFNVGQSFDAGVYISSQLIVFGGSMPSASIEADNTGSINMVQAEVEDMYVHLADASEATVNVTNTLGGFLLTASTLFYKGNPQLDVDCSIDSQLIPL